MKTNTTQSKIRDYSKPIMIRLQGIEGFKTYVRIVTTPAKKYDAAEAMKLAAENLKKQGLTV